MGTISALMYGLHFRLETEVIAMIVAGVFHAGANAWATSRKNRSDAADAVRWLFNLVIFDVLMMLVMKPQPQSLCVFWTILVISAQADLFSQRYRRVVVAAGLAAGISVMIVIGKDEPVAAKISASVGMIAVVWLFERMEAYWVQEVLNRRESEKQVADARLRAELLERDAMIGVQQRTISHELANLVTIIDLSTRHKDRIDHDRVRRSIDFVKRINSLVMNNGGKAPVVAERPLKDILSDVELLMRKDVEFAGIEWELTIDAETGARLVSERSGSLFLIMRNLVKNAQDAISARSPGPDFHGRIRIDVKTGVQGILVEVTDNGIGMTREQKERLMRGEASTTKSDGNGLGFRFVLAECERNGFTLTADSVQDEGTTMRVHLGAA